MAEIQAIKKTITDEAPFPIEESVYVAGPRAKEDSEFLQEGFTFFINQKTDNHYVGWCIKGIKEIPLGTNFVIPVSRFSDTSFYKKTKIEKKLLEQLIKSSSKVEQKHGDLYGALKKYRDAISVNKKAEENTEELIVHPPSLIERFYKEINQNLLDEMVGKVDISRIQNLLSIQAKHRDYKTVRVSKERTLKILYEWAKNKAIYYLFFGRKFYLSTNFETEITDEVFKSLYSDFIAQWPSYVPTLTQLDTTAIRNNKPVFSEPVQKQLERSSSPLLKYDQATRLLNKLFDNKNFNNAFARLLEQQKTTDYVYLSIDPYDYLTLSVNKESWDSCYDITKDSMCKSAPLTLLRDETSLVAMRTNNQDYPYDYGFKFTGNSKKWRQIVNIDPTTCSAVFGRQYPTEDICAASVRETYEKHVADTFGIENEWFCVTKKYDNKNYEVNPNFSCTDTIYKDVTSGSEKFSFIYLPSVKTDPVFLAGVKGICVHCGCTHERQKSTVCEKCITKSVLGSMSA